jgi:hypothetical protein
MAIKQLMNIIQMQQAAKDLVAMDEREKFQQQKKKL